ncbi:hypothetical protein [Nonlabens dokdonensis]|nr:hypothetical protein [Nonlabens dokdonensis]
MKNSNRILNLNSDFPILSRNRSFDENLPFDEDMEASRLFFLC